MTLIDRLLLADLARVLRLVDPVPARVREEAIRALDAVHGLSRAAPPRRHAPYLVATMIPCGVHPGHSRRFGSRKPAARRHSSCCAHE